MVHLNGWLLLVAAALLPFCGSADETTQDEDDHLFYQPRSLSLKNDPGSNQERSRGSKYIDRFAEVCGHRNTPRLIGGRKAEPGDWTWMVALFRGQVRGGAWEHFCGGTLITDQHVLTAAHCVWRMSPARVRVRGGNVDVNQTDEAEVESMIVHPKYNQRRNDFIADIAIVKLKKPFPLNDRFSVCCLPGAADSTKRLGNVLGWGTTVPDREEVTDLLQELELPILSNEACGEKYGRNIPVTQVCAAIPNVPGYDSCKGDSGGPLLLPNRNGTRWWLEGIVSHGPLPCAQINKPGIYTRVISYRRWITENVV